MLMMLVRWNLSSLDSRDDGEHSGVGLVGISKIFAMLDGPFIETLALNILH